jgi:hypothetical protein
VYAGVPQVIHEVAPVYVLNINVIVVAPAVWPAYIEPKPITAALEAVIPTDKLRAHHVERMVAAKVLMIIGVRYPAIMVAIVPVAAVAVVPMIVIRGSGLPCLRPLGALRFSFLWVLLF